jgi:aspartate 1-decarboxylase
MFRPAFDFKRAAMLKQASTRFPPPGNMPPIPPRFCGAHRENEVIKVIRAKLHGLRVTGADLHYHGSITLDPEHAALAGLYPCEFVEIWNKNSGARITTYVIYGEAGSRCCILNGAAARTCQVGDEIIIAASADVKPSELYDLRPKVLTFTADNEVDEILYYDVYKSAVRDFDFRIVNETENRIPAKKALAR